MNGQEKPRGPRRSFSPRSAATLALVSLRLDVDLTSGHSPPARHAPRRMASTVGSSERCGAFDAPPAARLARSLGRPSSRRNSRGLSASRLTRRPSLPQLASLYALTQTRSTRAPRPFWPGASLLRHLFCGEPVIVGPGSRDEFRPSGLVFVPLGHNRSPAPSRPSLPRRGPAFSTSATRDDLILVRSASFSTFRPLRRHHHV